MRRATRTAVAMATAVVGVVVCVKLQLVHVGDNRRCGSGWIDGRVFCRCLNEVDACSPNPCPGGFDCKVSGGNFHCDPLPQVSHTRRRR